jgi:competence protein CoiA
MLTAICENGGRICLADIKNTFTLQALKEKESFFCPTCKEKMILKICLKKVSHFAHYRASSCSEQFENESSYHLDGKQKLYHWLKGQGLEPELEFFDQAIQQRPDIRFSYQNTRYAVEYQCSTIPESLFIKRTSTYQQNGYTPLWILGGNQLLRKSPPLISLSDFQYLSLVMGKTNTFLPYFCPNSNRFILLRQIIPVTIRNCFASISINPPDMVNIDDLINPHNQFPTSIKHWRKEISSFKQNYSQKPQSFSDPFLKQLYTNHLHLLYLPPEIGLPVLHGAYIRTPPVIWQGFLYLDVLRNCAPGEIFSFAFVYQAFKNRVNKKQITLRLLPLGEGNASIAVLEYLHTLCDSQYLTMINKQTFKVNYYLKASQNMMEQEQTENNFYRNYHSSFLK